MSHSICQQKGLIGQTISLQFYNLDRRNKYINKYQKLNLQLCYLFRKIQISRANFVLKMLRSKLTIIFIRGCSSLLGRQMCLFSVSSNAGTREPLGFVGKNSASVGKIDAGNRMCAEHTTQKTQKIDVCKKLIALTFLIPPIRIFFAT